MTDITTLIMLAVEARNKAYAPYSGHPVGAALATVDGGAFSGGNVENAAFPLGTCAEQAAIAAMVRGGGREIAELVVVGPGDGPCPPCGGCRQRILEFAAPDARVHLCNERAVLKTMTLGELLPEPFNTDNGD